MRKLTRTEVDEILLAATILGTGGGGSLDEGMKLMDGYSLRGRISFWLITTRSQRTRSSARPICAARSRP